MGFLHSFTDLLLDDFRLRSVGVVVLFPLVSYNFFKGPEVSLILFMCYSVAVGTQDRKVCVIIGTTL